MVNLTLEIPDEMAHMLKGIAAAQHKTVEELALERLRSLAESKSSRLPGSPAAVRNALLGLSKVTVAEVEELEAAIALGRLPLSAGDLIRE